MVTCVADVNIQEVTHGCENADTSLDMCSSLSRLKSDMFQVVLSAEVPVLSECQYDSSSHTVTGFHCSCTLFTTFSLTHSVYAHEKKHTDTYTHTKMLCFIIHIICLDSVHLCPLSLQQMELDLAA